MTDVIERYREMLRAGVPLDDILALMRREGHSQVASIRLLVELNGMSLPEAKAAVHLSPAWSDQQEQTDSFHEQLEEVGKQFEKRKPPKE
jgi:hypothetical protein